MYRSAAVDDSHVGEQAASLVSGDREALSPTADVSWILRKIDLFWSSDQPICMSLPLLHACTASCSWCLFVFVIVNENAAGARVCVMRACAGRRIRARRTWGAAQEIEIAAVRAGRVP